LGTPEKQGSRMAGQARLDASNQKNIKKKDGEKMEKEEIKEKCLPQPEPKGTSKGNLMISWEHRRHKNRFQGGEWSKWALPRARSEWSGHVWQMGAG